MNIPPPQPSRLNWRTVTTSDKQNLPQLDAACKEKDGYELVSDMPSEVMAAYTADPHRTVCAAYNNTIAAICWLQPTTLTNHEFCVNLGGRVHPEFRRQGLGSFLLQWAESYSSLTFKSRAGLRLVIRNEALTADAHTIYQDFGYEQELAEHMLVCSLQETLPYPSLPEGLHTQAWDAQSSTGFFHAYQASFRDLPGFQNLQAEDWISDFESGAGFQPALSRVVFSAGQSVAFITCSELGGFGWISQVGVVPKLRGQGIAFGLIAEVLHQFCTLGYKEVGLFVNVFNAGAALVFHQLGFRRKLTRANYVKVTR